MKRSTKKILYVAGGTALAFAWVFTMPFQYLTTLRLGRGYLTFDDQQKSMLIIFPLAALVGGLTTLKHRTAENFLLNAASGMTILLVIRSLQEYAYLTFAVLIITAGLAVRVCRKIWRHFQEDIYRGEPDNKASAKCLMRMYLMTRRIIIYSLLLCLSSCALVTTLHEKYLDYRLEKSEGFDIVYNYEYVRAENEEKRKESAIREFVVSEAEWKQLPTQDRQNKAIAYAKGCLEELGVKEGHYEIIFVKELSDSRLGYYDDEQKTICINNVWLGKTDEKQLLDCIFHESFHAYQAMISEIYGELQDEGYQVELFPDFADVSEYVRGYESYAADSNRSFEAYENNPVEYFAREYAAEKVEHLQDVLCP